MHINILKRIVFIGRKKIFLLFLCVGTLFIYNYIFRSNSLSELDHKEVLNIREFIEQDASGYKTAEGKKRKFMNVSEYVENCGMPTECSRGSFPIHLYTGKASNDSPKLCVGGYYVFDKNINNPGRGLNLAVVDSNNSAVYQVRHFDTYESDSTQLEMFLENYLQSRDILIIFTNDEASTKLSGLVKSILESLGSALLQNLKFRSSWYMITQKGIQGFTPFEEISLPDKSQPWGKVFDQKLCIPFEIKGRSIHPDILAKETKERRDFCEKASGYGDFCNADLNDLAPLFMSDVYEKALVDHPIYSVPIIVLAGVSLYSLPITLETVMRQPGINPKMITVFYLPALAEAAQIAALFKANAVAMNSSYLFEDQVEFAFNYVVESYTDASHIIFLEEELVLSTDFLMYMATMMPLLEKDPTLYAISAWNDNGFKGTSSNSQISYRVNNFPGIGFMISKTTYIRQMRGHMKECCSNRPWNNWHLPSSDAVEIVVPDVSRVLRRPYEGLGPNTALLEALLNRERRTFQLSDKSIENGSMVILSNYEQQIEKLLNTATLLDMSSSQLADCIQHEKNSGSYFTPKSKQKQAYVLYYKQSGPKDLVTLKALCQCFGLFHADGEPPRGLHQGLLRFTIDGHDMMLIGSSSPYYKHKPSYHQPLDSFT